MSENIENHNSVFNSIYLTYTSRVHPTRTMNNQGCMVLPLWDEHIGDLDESRMGVKTSIVSISDELGAMSCQKTLYMNDPRVQEISNFIVENENQLRKACKMTENRIPPKEVQYISSSQSDNVENRIPKMTIDQEPQYPLIRETPLTSVDQKCLSKHNNQTHSNFGFISPVSQGIQRPTEPETGNLIHREIFTNSADLTHKELCTSSGDVSQKENYSNSDLKNDMRDKKPTLRPNDLKHENPFTTSSQIDRLQHQKPLKSSSSSNNRRNRTHTLSSGVNAVPRHQETIGSTWMSLKWSKKSLSLDTIFLTIALLCIVPVSGGFDRGGFQHQITWGRGNSPPGSAVFGNSPTNVTAVLGHKARLPCQVKSLGLKDVSWIRQRDLHILTVGIFTYTSDDRFKVFHPHETEDWYLDITSVTFRDSGVYECQVSTSPKVSLPITLTVLGVQQADIPGPAEVFIQHGSTISLQCEVHAGVEAVGPVHWLKGPNTLNYSSPRGGISMEVEKTPTSTTSKLYITRAIRADSGNYTCAPLFAKPDSVLVHVVNAGEESAAAVHSGGSGANFEIEKSILILISSVLPIPWMLRYFIPNGP